MSIQIKPQSNRPFNVLISGTAPGTKGDKGAQIESMALDGNNVLTTTMSDGSQVQCDAAELVKNAAQNAVSAVTESLVFFVDEHGARIGIEFPTVDPMKKGYAWLNGTYLCVSDGPDT